MRFLVCALLFAPLAATAQAPETVAQPAVEPGSTRIVITVSGTVQLQ